MQYFPDDSDLGKSLEYYGEHRQRELDLLDRFVAAGMSVMEVDADVGAHALWLSRRIGPEGHLLVYEDDRMRRQVLDQNVKANGVANATLMPRRLRQSRRDAAASSIDCPDGDRQGLARLATERDETIDDLRLGRLDYLKLNRCDGAIDILEGAAETLWRLRPGLHFIVSGADELARLVARVRDFGYACWRFESPLFNSQNFNNRDKDIFSGRTAIALIALPEERAADVSLESCRKIA
jgi:hypothetical protein